MNWQVLLSWLKSSLPWFKGLIAAFIGAGAQAITVVVVDPIAFNFTNQWKKTMTAALVAAVLAAAGYLAKSPVPEAKTNEEIK